MKITYNVGNKTALTEPVLIVRFVPDAKRNQNFTYLYWRTQPDPLWRNLPYSSVLQKTETQMAFAEKGSFSKYRNFGSMNRATTVGFVVA